MVLRNDFAPKGQWAISGDILVGTTGCWGEGVGSATGILWVEVKDAAKHSIVQGRPPHLRTIYPQQTLNPPIFPSSRIIQMGLNLKLSQLRLHKGVLYIIYKELLGSEGE